MGTTTYDERLTVPWPWWPVALAIVAALSAPFGVGTLGWPGWVAGFGGLATVTVAGLWWLGRVRVAVAGGATGPELVVDDARLPVRFIAEAIPLDATGRQELLGPQADPLAFVVQRPWVPGAIQVVLDDPADPTPYWLISCRRPGRLAAALLAAAGSGRDGSGRDGSGRDGSGREAQRQVGA